MKNKVIQILEAAIVIAFGFIMMFNGGNSALNTYFGVVCIVGGVVFACLSLVTLIQNKVVPFGFLALASILIVFAVAIFMERLDMGLIIWLMVYALMGLGFALALFGVYSILKGNVLPGVVQIVLGAALVVLTAFYCGTDDFRRAFWIIAGIVVVLYGVLLVVSVLLSEKTKR